MSALRFFAILLIGAIESFAQSFIPHFAGEVVIGQEYKHDIGSGLFLALRPTGTGWLINIHPVVPCTDPDDWATPVNPPYRNYNSLYLDTGYGATAWEAVKMTPREVFFITNCNDYKLESKRLTIVLWPYTYSEQEADDARAKLGSSPLAKAVLNIRDSKVGRAAQDVEGKHYGKIDWIKFTVDVSPPRREPR